jgi:phosphoribosylamine--glycine ligase
MASRGYPQKYETGFEIALPEEKDIQIYVAGARLRDGKLLTSGGRVLGVTAAAPTLAEAIEKAYRGAELVKFENAYYRHDIGQKALKAGK